jgi:ATP-dependent RNA helicase RhlE
MPFENLGLEAELLRAVKAQGYDIPTPIQRLAIPVVLEGHDVLARAQTGTGKTAAFTLPMLQILSERDGGRKPRALVLTPTRELAAQVGESVVTYGKYYGLRSTVIFGGVGIQPQKDKLRRGVDIVVATPGRLLDLENQRCIDLSGIEILVLDEADRMLDMGFIHDIKRILALLPKRRQNLLFSATFSKDIQRLADRLLHKPKRIEVEPHNTAAETVEHQVYRIGQKEKRDLLVHLIDEGDWSQVLVFTRTKHRANRLAQQLVRAGIEASAIHGNKSQSARTRALAGFKAGEVKVLVATDIAARGLDIDRLPYVVNYEIPNVPEDYVHRIGRTGRAGETGTAVSLVDSEEVKLLEDIEWLLKAEIPRIPVPKFTPKKLAPAPAGESNSRRRPAPVSRKGTSGRSSSGHMKARRSPSSNSPSGGESPAGQRPGRRRRRRKVTGQVR